MLTKKNLKISAIICAAGKGERAGFCKNKLLAPLYGAPVIAHTLKKFDFPLIDEVIIASSADDFGEISAIAKPFGYKVVLGGETRTQSVKNALEAVTGDIVLIHDGARPFVTRGLIEKCVDSVARFGSGICALPVTETVAVSDYGTITDVPDRSYMYSLQTPQGFFADDIRRAYSLTGGKIYTDDSAVFREFIGFPHLVAGEKGNIKLTYPEDFNIELKAAGIMGTADIIGTAGTMGTADIKDGGFNYSSGDIAGGTPVGAIARPALLRTGLGIDVHPFTEGKYITLGGVKIDCGYALAAHSDGDVIYHAVTDALLSGAGLKDIGHYFPDGDGKWKNADSAHMCALALGEVKKAGYAPLNICIAVQAEKPRLAPYIDEMKKNIAATLKIGVGSVGISAGTCEKLGFVGEGLGIAAYASALLKGEKDG